MELISLPFYSEELQKNKEAGMWWSDDLVYAVYYAVKEGANDLNSISDMLRVCVVPATDIEKLLRETPTDDNPTSLKKDYGGFTNYKLPNFNLARYPYRTIQPSEVATLQPFFENGDVSNGRLKAEFSQDDQDATTLHSRGLVIK